MAHAPLQTTPNPPAPHPTPNPPVSHPAPEPSDGPRRVVVITGAGTGIGRATARAFAAQGAHVVAVGRRPEPLAETAAAAADADGAIVPYPADITADGAPEALVGHVVATHGRLDVLVNNAAVVGNGALGSHTKESMAPQLATNLLAPVLLTQEAVPVPRRPAGPPA
ncbi:ketoreductase [Streptomyces noursei ZPM]|nr:ketoreductase [Streptomyces noursei ZPM]